MFGTVIQRVVGGVTKSVLDALAPYRKQVIALQADARQVWQFQAAGQLAQDESNAAVARISERIARANAEAGAAGVAVLQASVPERQARRSEQARRVVATFRQFIADIEALRQGEVDWSQQSAHPEMRGLIFTGGLSEDHHLHRILTNGETPEFLLRIFEDSAARLGVDLQDGRLAQLQQQQPAPRVRPTLPASAAN